MNNYLLITRGAIVFPGTTRSIKIGRELSIKTVEEVMKTQEKQIIICTQKNIKKSDVTDINDIYNVGSLATITYIEKEKEDLNVEVVATSRVLINSFEVDKETKTIKADYVLINDKELLKEDVGENFTTLLSLLDRSHAEIAEKIRIEILNRNKNNIIVDHAQLIYEIANQLPISFEQKQQILSLNTLNLKVEAINNLISSKTDMTSVDREVNNKINDSLNKQQKEFYLREKMRVVKEELGELSSKENDANNLRKRLRENPYPEHIKIKMEQEINRLEASNPQETSMIRTYIEWVLDLPWWQESKDNNNIEKVKEVLDKSHYGLEKVKERIIEYLAVRAKSQNTKAPIMCLVGPPGVGKSSLAKSIAEALDKPFVKMALGGVKDESEIRGHRRTYLGAMPGRIVKAMKKAGVINPLFLLDELDKMSSDQRGDPASAMLEVLDPEQNDKFSDNYIEEDYNLSKVMFVATANYADQIPPALYDRLEIIELTSYTELEKLAIAKQYLIPKVLLDSGLSAKDLKFSDEALLYIIRHYTKEAGVRELERMIRKIARKFVVKLSVNKKIKTESIDIAKSKDYLDKEIYEYTMKDEDLLPGIVNGMAYTSAGGDLLQIEVTTFKGKGDIKITGNLKETMRESAEVALAYVKANAKKFGLDEINFKEIDVHIHVPSGGIPKDGPSAGVTLVTAIISCLKQKPIKNTISMTGEITLRGRVLIIGGVKEKVISAFRGGVNEIFIPDKDERYLKDVPPEVLNNIKVHLVSKYEDIYKELFSK